METTTTETQTAEVLGLERETCGRCGGSGHYSYCQRYGTKCFGCSGSGKRYTKRGAAAAAFLEKLREVRADSLKVGDVIRVSGITGGADVYDYFARIVEIKPTEVRSWAVAADGTRTEHDYTGHVDITTEHAKLGRGGMGGVAPDAMIRKGWSAAEKLEQLRQAIAYQETLTKAGTPRKARGAK